MRQSEALAILNAGANVFLTGAPGAGKTYVLNEFIRQARADGANVAVTASTGIAATHIDGQTIHSWSGVGLANVLTPNLLKTIKDPSSAQDTGGRRAHHRRGVDDARLAVRHGRIRCAVKCGMILGRSADCKWYLSGDFFQLPPVSVSGRDRDVLPPGPDFGGVP